MNKIAKAQIERNSKANRNNVPSNAKADRLRKLYKAIKASGSFRSIQ